MKDWLAALEDCVRDRLPAVLVTIADAKGSSPREAGVKMLVSEADAAGTVGGGNLEHEAIRLARAMLEEGRERPDLRNFALGPSLGQCCGGSTKLLFEPFAGRGHPSEWLDKMKAFAEASTPSILISEIDGRDGRKLLLTSNEQWGDLAEQGLAEQGRKMLASPGNAGARLWTSAGKRLFLLEQNPGLRGQIVLIGAGHVGKALAPILATLPFHVTWADNRPEQFPEQPPANLRIRCTPHLDTVIQEAEPNTIFLVMTYSHDLDYALCAQVLQRDDFRYLGLIGSATKRARFEKTMRDLDIDQAVIDRVACPIGLPGIDSKQPSVIAVATAAQILAL